MPSTPLKEAQPDELIDWNLRPFRPGEADQVKKLLSKIVVAAKYADPNVIESNCWRDVIEAARFAEFREQQVIDEKEEGPRERNRFREKLNKIAKTSNPKLTDDIKILVLLAYGACCLGLIRRPPELLEEAAYLKTLLNLTAAQIREIAKEALRSPFLAADKGGRPLTATLDGYVEALIGIYERASGMSVIRQPAPHVINARKLSNSGLLQQLMDINSPPMRRRKRNNMIRFISACLAPLVSYSTRRDEAISKSVRRIQLAAQLADKLAAATNCKSVHRALRKP